MPGWQHPLMRCYITGVAICSTCRIHSCITQALPSLLSCVFLRRYVCCMNPTAGSFVINPRLQRLFMTLAMDFPGQDSLMKIYGTFLQVRMGAHACVHGICHAWGAPLAQCRSFLAPIPGSACVCAWGFYAYQGFMHMWESPSDTKLALPSTPVPHYVPLSPEPAANHHRQPP